jgi:hypothetical protein
MFIRKLPAFILGVLSLAVLLAIPATVAAQSNTFIVAFDRTGTPETELGTVLDPLTGQVIETVVETGAFVNPCTLENVDVFGSSTITSLETVDKFLNRKVSVSVVTKGTGTGWTEDAGVRTDSGNTYTFSDSQSFSFRIPPSGQAFSSDFSDKLALRGAKSVDNWVIRAHFKITVDADGMVKVFLIKTNADACKG